MCDMGEGGGNGNISLDDAISVEDAKLPSVLNTQTTLQNRNFLQTLYFHGVTSNFVVVVVVVLF